MGHTLSLECGSTSSIIELDTGGRAVIIHRAGLEDFLTSSSARGGGFSLEFDGSLTKSFLASLKFDGSLTKSFFLLVNCRWVGVLLPQIFIRLGIFINKKFVLKC